MQLNISNCPRCGRVFQKSLKNICPNCIMEEDRQYELCYRFLRDNRQCNLKELSEETGVPAGQITKFIREGRISLHSHPNFDYPCERCGTAIRQGTYCQSCQGELSKSIESELEKEKLRQQQAQQLKKSNYQIRD